MMSTRTECHLGLALCASPSFNVAFLAAQGQAPQPETTKVRSTSSPIICCLDQHVGFVGGTTAACRTQQHVECGTKSRRIYRGASRRSTNVDGWITGRSDRPA